MLPHKVFEEDKFYEKAKNLRGRFDNAAPDCLFPTAGSATKNVPMDGLALFISNTWDKIRTQKELNLPDQRIMVASLRCGELKDEALQLIQQPVQKLREESERRVVTGFATRCTDVIKQALGHFDEFAH